jgi:hypothetical protein
VFLKLWSADHWWSMAVSQVIRSDPQAVLEEKIIAKIV